MKTNLSKLKRAAGMLSIAKEKTEAASKLITGDVETDIQWHVAISEIVDIAGWLISSIEERIKNER